MNQSDLHHVDIPTNSKHILFLIQFKWPENVLFKLLIL